MNAWILVSAPDEASAVDQCWDGDEWVAIANVNNALASTIAAGTTIEIMRASKGEFQQRFTDRDIRLAEATVSIAIGALVA